MKDAGGLAPEPARGATSPGAGRDMAALDPGWVVTFTGSSAEEEPSRAAQTALADGAIGTAGSPPVRVPGARYEVIVGGVYVGTGAPTDMLRAPTWSLLDGEPAADPDLVRTLDLRSGTLHQSLRTARGPLEVTTFSSMASPGTVALRARGAAARPRATGPLDTEGETTGTIVPATAAPSGTGGPAGPTVVRLAAHPGGVAIAARDTTWVDADGAPGLDRLGAYVSGSRRLPTEAAALRRLAAAERLGFDRLLDGHRAAWARRWDDADIRMSGDVELQRAIRFCLYHLIGLAPDRGEAAVGARGISGPGYKGHVFWDADVFDLPFFAATHPAVARAMLEYRVRRLDAALANAVAEGYVGAWFPWESARDGRDVTPRWGITAAGERVRIWSGDRELHITADVAWAAQTYIDWTGDTAFAEGPARRLFIETARFWASRLEMDADGRGHMTGVVGPDEYHELIDDNAFTNVMARWNLRHAARVTAGDPSVSAAERALWEARADAIVDGFDPAAGRYEQFAGFSALEPLIARDLHPRPYAADAVLGRELVVGSQILKQPDVLMLHHLIPDELVPGSLIPDLEYYEPRTSHGSSLSPAVHAALLARVGRLDEAVAAFVMSARIDLDELLVSAAHGMHAATDGGLWQALVMGFGGIRPSAGALSVDPHVPAAWGEMVLPVRYRGSRVRVKVDQDRMEVRARPAATIAVGPGAPAPIGPGGARFRRTNAGWEPLA